MSMLHGLEVRVPMLANDMLAFGAELPLERREVEGSGKQPLRAVAEALVPSLARPSPKKGFSFPVDAWMQRGLGALWRDRGIVPALAGAGFRADALEALIGRYAAGANVPSRRFELRLLANRLYDLTVLGLWLEREGIEA
jgi:asparagine synthase (glutamine-hydrolysing)